MQFDSFNIDQVFDNFVSIMKENGTLDRPGEYIMPESILDSVGTKDIDISDELRKKAEKGAAKMYGISSDDVVGDAHDGSVKVVDAAGDLGVVETIQDAHKKIQDIATKKIKIARKVAALAQELDDANFFKLANRLDAALAEFLNVKTASKEQYEGALDQLNQLVLETVLGNNHVVNHYRTNLIQVLEQLLERPSAAGLKAFSKQYYNAAVHLGKVPDGKDAAKAMYDSYADVLELVSLGVKALSQTLAQPGTVGKKASASSKKIRKSSSSYLSNLKRLKHNLFEQFDFGEYQVSVQASADHYSTPSKTLDDPSEYTEFEVAVLHNDRFVLPSELMDLAVPHSSSFESDGIAPYVPREKVEEILQFFANLSKDDAHEND